MKVSLGSIVHETVDIYIEKFDSPEDALKFSKVATLAPKNHCEEIDNWVLEMTSIETQTYVNVNRLMSEK